ncbi:response regulator [Brevibacillus dissolubilis]|uniref:response regulator n=1 Tax=Brevibacillus dissolubilis TaxID=1844116 RepID=UPI0011160D54|nr:response regulator [Brevibacillus dissolubilis]
MDIKAMIVDDEVHILKNLSMVIPWAELGIEIVALAKNGVEALEQAEVHQPDLILSDIRMPMLDGIGLLQQLREQNHQCEVILLTGFTDFEYTRSAIRYGVKDYIVKPINYQELHEVIERIAGQIRSRKQEHVSEMRKWREMNEMAYQKLLFDALMGLSNPESRYLFDEKGMAIEQLRFILFVVDVDEYAQQARHWDERERKVWNFAIHNVLLDLIEEREIEATLLQMREGEWCILVEQREDRGLRQSDGMIAWAEDISYIVEHTLGFAVSIGVHEQAVGISELPPVYQQAKKTVHLHLMSKGSKVNVTAPKRTGASGETDKSDHTDDTNPFGETTETSETEASWWPVLEEFVSRLKRNDVSNMQQSLHDLQVYLQSISHLSLVRAERILQYFVLHLVREMRDMKILSAEQEERVWSKLEHSRGLKDLLLLIQYLMESSIEESVKKKTSEVLMIAAKEYIQRNLGRDLGIDEVAGFLEISSSYFSLIFKQHVGETFVEYVTRERMERALSLLVMSNKSITEISREVGYRERRYFTKVFQKCVGMTPSEYREKAIANAK